MKKLTGADYLTKPYRELKEYPDFSPHAFRIVEAITKLGTRELEKIDLTNIGGKSRGAN